MKKLLGLLLLALGFGSCNAQKESVFPVESFKTQSGKSVDMYLINHGSLAINFDGYWVQIDPVTSFYGKSFDYSSFPKADMILITHEHGDHLNKESISALSKDNTRLLLNATSQKQIDKGEIMKNYQTVTVNGLDVNAFPAYNTTAGREKFHPKGNGNAYLLTFDGFKVFISGDSEDIPEYSALKEKNIDVAFLSANQPYTMTAEQCINAAKVIQPKVLIPYHLGETDMQKIKTGLEDTNIKVSLYESLR